MNTKIYDPVPKEIFKYIFCSSVEIIYSFAAYKLIFATNFHTILIKTPLHRLLTVIVLGVI